jgi:hypothetical protein
MISVVAAALSWPPEAWSAAAAWVTATIALTALLVARGQLREARRLRREQAQPYVAVFTDHSGADPQLLDLVVRNFGTTAATDVAIRIDPPPHRASTSSEGYGAVWIPDRIPTLVPGQEWRTLWDFTPDRAAAELPDSHDAVVTFRDSWGEIHSFSYVLDWSATRQRMYATVYGAHHGVKALREISETLRKQR